MSLIRSDDAHEDEDGDGGDRLCLSDSRTDVCAADRSAPNICTAPETFIPRHSFRGARKCRVWFVGAVLSHSPHLESTESCFSSKVLSGKFFRTKWDRHGHHEKVGESRRSGDLVGLIGSSMNGEKEGGPLSVVIASLPILLDALSKGSVRCGSSSGGTTHVFATPNGNCPSLQKRVFIPLSKKFLLFLSVKHLHKYWSRLYS